MPQDRMHTPHGVEPSFIANDIQRLCSFQCRISGEGPLSVVDILGPACQIRRRNSKEICLELDLIVLLPKGTRFSDSRSL